MNRRFTRGLRFRLTAFYALFFSCTLILVAALFRERLESSLNAQSQDVLKQEWMALKGYLKIEIVRGKDRITWFYDRQDPEEGFIVGQLQRVFLLTDADGKVIQFSDIYHSIGFDSPEQIKAAIAGGPNNAVWSVRRDGRGTPYLIRAGVVFDEKHTHAYFVALGRSIAPDNHILREFSLIYFVLIPTSVLIACLLGWVLAGYALRPVTAVAQTANRITGSNLSLRIATRGAGDELDYLIETLNRMIERLEASFRQIRQFSSDVSHELRTPITAIRGQLEVALFTAQTAEQYRDAIFNSMQDIERLSQIIRALLLLSQAESGQVALQKSRLDLAAVAHDIVEQFQIPAEGARVRLSASLGADCFADVDKVQIERLISNLLSNAIKFTPPGGEVRVGLRRQGEGIELAVEDTGCGIDPAHVPHIFDRFYQVRGQETNAGTEKGVGLGLSFVAWIAKAHGGTVEVASQPGQGSRFTVRLPASAAAPPVARPQNQAVATG